MSPREGIPEITATVRAELDHLEHLRREMASVQADDSLIMRRSKGSIIQDFYNCCERIFRSIAVEIIGGYEESEQWHKALLHRMTMPMEDLRPAVISEELAAELDDYLSFRHVFRNIYGFELRGDRIVYLSAKFDRTAERFREEILEFCRGLQ